MHLAYKTRSVLIITTVLIAWCSLSVAGPSAADCAAEADRASRGSGSILGGAASSATRGAIFGAIVGNKESARKGAKLGAVVGGIRQGVRKNDVYKRVYDACMYRY